MPLTPDELNNKVQQFIQSLGWTDRTETLDAARDFHVTVDAMISFIVQYCMSGGGKGPGPLPHRPPPPPPPWPAEPRREDYLGKMTGLLLNIANNTR